MLVKLWMLELSRCCACSFSTNVWISFWIQGNDQKVWRLRVSDTHPCRLVKLVGHIWEQGMVELAEEQSLTVQCGTGTKQHRRGK